MQNQLWTFKPVSFRWEQTLRFQTDLLELRNIATVAEFIVRCALIRPESRRLNCNLDFPDLNPDRAQRDSVARREN